MKLVTNLNDPADVDRSLALLTSIINSGTYGDVAVDPVEEHVHNHGAEARRQYMLSFIRRAPEVAPVEIIPKAASERINLVATDGRRRPNVCHLENSGRAHFRLPETIAKRHPGAMTNKPSYAEDGFGVVLHLTTAEAVSEALALLRSAYDVSAET